MWCNICRREGNFSKNEICFECCNSNIRLKPGGLDGVVWGKSIYRICDFCNIKGSVWKKIKKDIKEREGDECWMCGETEGALQAHEIWKQDEYGIIYQEIHHLCFLCHATQHMGLWSLPGKSGIRKMAEEKAGRTISEHIRYVNSLTNERFKTHELKNYKISPVSFLSEGVQGKVKSCPSAYVCLAREKEPEYFEDISILGTPEIPIQREDDFYTVCDFSKEKEGYIINYEKYASFFPSEFRFKEVLEKMERKRTNTLEQERTKKMKKEEAKIVNRSCQYIVRKAKGVEKDINKGTDPMEIIEKFLADITKCCLKTSRNLLQIKDRK